jgi:hypothetical protein
VSRESKKKILLEGGKPSMPRARSRSKNRSRSKRRSRSIKNRSRYRSSLEDDTQDYDEEIEDAFQEMADNEKEIESAVELFFLSSRTVQKKVLIEILRNPDYLEFVKRQLTELNVKSGNY